MTSGRVVTVNNARRRRPSVADVARVAGVSVGTVSNVLNRPEFVSPHTRDRVHVAIEELSFVRNGRARQLRQGSSTTVGAVLLDIRNPFFTDVARGIEDRLADAITRFTGSMTFVYLHLVLFGAWIAANLGLVPGVPRFDPTFVVLAMAASVEAIFISTFVLISQNRMAALADRRADLDLQISLLAEHEVSRVIALVTSIAERLGMEEARDPELEELAQDVEPARVMDRISQEKQEPAAES